MVWVRGGCEWGVWSSRGGWFEERKRSIVFRQAATRSVARRTHLVWPPCPQDVRVGVCVEGRDITGMFDGECHASPLESVT